MTRQIRERPRHYGFLLLAMLLLAVFFAVRPNDRALATSGDSPYTVPFATD